MPDADSVPDGAYNPVGLNRPDADCIPLADNGPAGIMPVHIVPVDTPLCEKFIGPTITSPRHPVVWMMPG